MKMIVEKHELMSHPERVETKPRFLESLADFLCKSTDRTCLFGDGENRCLYEANWMPTGVVCVTNTKTYRYFHLSVREALSLAVKIRSTICNSEEISSMCDEDFDTVMSRKMDNNLRGVFE